MDPLKSRAGQIGSSKVCGFAILVLAVLLMATASPIAPAFHSVQAQQDTSDDDLNDDFLTFDETPPSIKITNPSSCSNSIASPGIVIVQGVASDDLAGVKNVEAFSHTYPFYDDYPFVMATPLQADWSSWSIPVEIHDTRTRILVKATDNADNENWDEVIIDIEEMQAKHSSRGSKFAVAFVEPTFTSAAYNADGFYEFYDKYADVDFDQEITDDLHLMTADIPAEPDRTYFEPLVQRVKSFLPTDIPTVIIGDTDVHDGFIFRDDGTNAYKVLFLLHNEYVTQQEYENLRLFVFNGGKIVFLDGNIFYGEVSFDSLHCTATLLKGHDWEFDGKTVKRSVSERYFNETREWVGSNYMINALWDPVYFTNNPFNYTHFEENYVANPDATILHDYGLKIGDTYEADDWHQNETIATYELNHGQGKSIVLGIYAQNEANDPAFLDFFEDVVLMHSLGNEYKVSAGGKEYSVYWRMNSGSLGEVIANGDSRKLTVGLNRDGNANDSLKISLPRNLIDIATASNSDSEEAKPQNASEMKELIIVPLNAGGIVPDGYSGVGQQVMDHEIIIEIPLSSEIRTVEFYGAYVAPEFGIAGMLFLISAIAIACSIGVVTIFSRKRV